MFGHISAHITNIVTFMEKAAQTAFTLSFYLLGMVASVSFSLVNEMHRNIYILKQSNVLKCAKQLGTSVILSSKINTIGLL